MAMAAIEEGQGRRFLGALSGPGEIVRQFTPNWFAVTMGTGILAVALGQFPQSRVLFGTGEALWIANMVLFVGFSALYLARWVLHFDGACRILGHSSMSMFLGCIPMGLATIVNGFLLFGGAHAGNMAVDIALALWWVDVALAFACGLGVPFLMFTRQTHTIEQMSAVWLLPVVACEVVATSGALLLPQIGDANLQLSILMTSYVLWACSVPLALSIIVILFLRLAIHKLPHAGMAPSSWLALGPIATGALAMFVLAENGPAVLAASELGTLATAIGGASFLTGLILWGYGIWWAVMASLVTAWYFRNPVPFNLGWWAYIFPLGVFALASIKLGDLLALDFIAWVGGALVAALALVWIAVIVRTLGQAWQGKLFLAPCLSDDLRVSSCGQDAQTTR
ncbi:TDT family transporter [Pelagibacterium nitratireducens]|uniref:TDT family transporter n=2 Tax=Pelagibacterium nitratireducens TaxID=1046114 RepID=A0ABZ2HW26_9HYPH|tara:strand:+ start:37467 stop:38654 length:1188 start_codon:yes stop_codon:yes gene_type:complete